MKKFVAVSLVGLICATVLFSGAASLSASAATESSADIQLSQSAFITAEDILKLCQDANEGKGLLATGGTTDTELRISFGNREEKINYYSYDDTDDSVNAGPITWLVAGSDSQDSVVLYSEEPIVGANNLIAYGEYDSRFQTTGDQNIAFVATYGTYHSSTPTSVYANHWGASSLRMQMQRLQSDTGAFSSIERSLMSTSTVQTVDYQSGTSVYYTTDDVLYAPSASSDTSQIKVGADDSITVDNAYVGSIHWLRTPSEMLSNYIYVTQPTSGISYSNFTNNIPSINVAFRLDLSSVAFASQASAAALSYGTLGKLSEDAPLTLRISTLKSPLAYSRISRTNSAISYTGAPVGSRLVLVITDENGESYHYYENVSGNGALALSSIDLNGYVDKSTQFVGKAWLEVDAENGGSITYATDPIDISSPQPDYEEWGESFTRPDGVVQYTDENGTVSVELSSENLDENGFLWIEESSDVQSALFGIDLSYGSYELDAGSRFYVELIDDTDGEYDKINRMIDTEIAERIEDEHALIFRMGIEDIYGEELHSSSEITNVYVQLGDGWDPDDIKAYTIYNNQDESVPATCKLADFAIVSLKDRSAYHLMFDELTDHEIEATPDDETTTLIPDDKPTQPDYFEENENNYDTSVKEKTSVARIIAIVAVVILVLLLLTVIIVTLIVIAAVAIGLTVFLIVLIVLIVKIVKKKKKLK